MASESIDEIRRRLSRRFDETIDRTAENSSMPIRPLPSLPKIDLSALLKSKPLHKKEGGGDGVEPNG